MAVEEFEKHHRKGLSLTIPQAIIFSLILNTLQRGTLQLFINPAISLVHSFSPSLMYISVSGISFIFLNHILRKKNINFILILGLHFLMSTIFLQSFVSSSNLFIIQNNLETNNGVFLSTNALFNFFISFVSSIYFFLSYFLYPNEIIYTSIKGLFPFLRYKEKTIFKQATKGFCKVLMISSVFYLIYRLIFNFPFIYLLNMFNVSIVVESKFFFMKHFVLAMISYFMFVLFLKILENLYIFNVSTTNRKFLDEKYFKDKDIFIRRFYFHQISNIFKYEKESQRMLLRNDKLMKCILEYAFDELGNLESILKEIESCNKRVESKKYYSVPCVVKREIKKVPEELISKKEEEFAVRKIKSYNFFEIFLAKLSFYLNYFKLERKYFMCVCYIRKIQDYIILFNKIGDTFELTKNFKEDFSMKAERIASKIEKIEDMCKVNLESKYFRELRWKLLRN